MSSALYHVFLTFNGNKAPSGTLVAVLTVLAALEIGYSTQIARRAGVERRNSIRVLRKLTELGLAERWREEGDPRELQRPLRVYYRITPAGRELTEQIMAGVSR